MRKHSLAFLFLLISFFSTFGQIKENDGFEQKVTDYFKLDYETIFTHLNKTKYYKGEELWFKTYVYDIKRQLPYISSTNIYTSIYNEDGQLIKKKLYAAVSGMTSGNFIIDSTYSPGTYYLKTSTNWMKNFNLDYSHIQQFEIVSDEKSNQAINSSKNDYDFQILPEGGHIIENVTNSIGFKAINDNGNSVKINSGKIIDSDKNVVAFFKSNSLGIGKFVFTPKKDKNYIYEVIFENGDTLTNSILNIENKGISLSIDNMQEQNLIIRLSTNNITIPSLVDNHYHLIVHRDGLMNKIKVDFAEDKLIYQYKVDRSILNKGLNIITLINENNQPIAERIVFNHNNSSVKNIEISEIQKTGDSMLIKLRPLGNIKNVNLSISVLPSSTEAHDRNSTIISSFLLNPYIKGTIENPWYYFSEMDREKIFDLDLLLLTQGWSRYSWENIFNSPPIINHNFESGFVIKGKLNNYQYKSGDKILLLSKENGIQEEVDLDKNNIFTFDNLYLVNESSVNFTLKSASGKLSKPNLYFNVYPIEVNDKIQIKKYIKQPSELTTSSSENSSFIFDVNATILDSISLVVNNTITKPKNKPFGTSLAKHISFAEAKNFDGLITDEIRRHGFDVTNNGINVKIISRRVSTLKGSLSPIVILDNVDLNHDLTIISNLRIEDVEEMFISKTSSIYASAGGVIHIFTKKGRSRFSKSSYSDSTIKFGFSVDKEYYSPYYNKFDNENFKKMAVLNWIPNLTQSDNGEISFKIPNYFNDDLNLYIEGMSEDGSLFSKVETISTK